MGKIARFADALDGVDDPKGEYIMSPEGESTRSNAM
jgi:hypothetical protein